MDGWDPFFGWKRDGASAYCCRRMRGHHAERCASNHAVTLSVVRSGWPGWARLLVTAHLAVEK
ncbi:hypothetical protein CRG98_012649 [Punica granatum]|uniref:Uncharacterized protein n=1 Tax=Punica granatum TaxID=22663 RepID=A0A2I0KEP9_PUNGR|nr:hypothetical protein CRG98_012649 [Punica granatum]